LTLQDFLTPICPHLTAVFVHWRLSACGGHLLHRPRNISPGWILVGFWYESASLDDLREEQPEKSGEIREAIVSREAFFDVLSANCYFHLGLILCQQVHYLA
jgi:hypothetical protein